MSRYKALALLLTTSLLTGCAAMGQAELLMPAVSTEQIDSFYKEANLFSFSHQLLMENINETNPVLSPVSAYLAMGMVGLGAAGDTLAEFQKTMGSEMHEVSRSLMQTLPAQPGTLENGRESKLHVNLANSVWVDDEMEPAQSWIDDVSGIYGAKAYRADLSAIGTMHEMNQWIEEETRGLIKKFLEKPLDAGTRLALFNTVYFYGEWQYKFDATSTYKDTFTKEDGTEQKVDMMHESNCNRIYVKQEDFDGIILPYRDGNKAFVALKPTAGQTVREMYEGLTEETFSQILAKKDTALINLKLPKFEVTFDKSLNETLQNMGIIKAFDEGQADFSGLGTTQSGEGLYISLVRQKAVVKLDEEGTEAAAVTMVVMNECAMAESPQQPIDVYFDEPFLYMIVDLAEEVPLFMGIMDSPQ